MRNHEANRLINEASPYLRLHAFNPVDWYPWGEAAFARAVAEDKPIFLSIGYYTCHWCHVMERESFADAILAERLNQDFVSIKVDREERPDVDRVYMAYVQATTGSGGWPLTAFLTPALLPFYGGTYFPPRDAHGVPSFARLLAAISQAWKNDRARLLATANDVSSQLTHMLSPRPGSGASPALPSLAAVWDKLAAQLGASYDAEHGGFGGAPKFPRPVSLGFLLRYAQLHRDSEVGLHASAMVVNSLRAMAAGGVHDQIGGGFHRYATDAGWRVPHFEKMLYDQAQLAVSFLEAWQLTHADDLADTARTTLDFVLTEMTSPEGGFYSALDADSPIPTEHQSAAGPREGEGAFYLWVDDDLARELPPQAADVIRKTLGIEPAGNVPSYLDPHGEFTGKNILFRAAEPAPDELAPFHAARAQLYNIRRRRPHPPLDDKILTAWNGLMISALALGAAALNVPVWLAAAQRAAHLLRSQHWHAATQTLYRRDRQPGADGVEAFSEDYAFLIHGLLDLHQADFDPVWMEWARQLQHRQDALFAAPGGGYYASQADSRIFLRLREEYDGAEPSASSVSVSNLLRLAIWFEDDGFRTRAEATLSSFASRLEQIPEAVPLLASTLEVASAPPRRLMLAGKLDAPDTALLLAQLRLRFLPGYSVMRAPEELSTRAAVFLCEDYTCQLPIHDPEELAAALDRR
ncbi:MAG TPA: thioredoxin domain-containing protein [Terriglobales bacterium]|nr:thioredoxin domain-containing protein [Terriglobales bacterium]